MLKHALEKSQWDSSISRKWAGLPVEVYYVATVLLCSCYKCGTFVFLSFRSFCTCDRDHRIDSVDFVALKEEQPKLFSYSGVWSLEIPVGPCRASSHLSPSILKLLHWSQWQVRSRSDSLISLINLCQCTVCGVSLVFQYSICVEQVENHYVTQRI